MVRNLYACLDSIASPLYWCNQSFTQQALCQQSSPSTTLLSRNMGKATATTHVQYSVEAVNQSNCKRDFVCLGRAHASSYASRNTPDWVVYPCRDAFGRPQAMWFVCFLIRSGRSYYMVWGIKWLRATLESPYTIVYELLVSVSLTVNMHLVPSLQVLGWRLQEHHGSVPA